VIRPFLVRYVLPIALAATLVAFVAVPHINSILTEWFRSDIQLRARLVMNSIDEPLTSLLRRSDLEHAGAYLAQVTSDERLLGIVICGASGTQILATPLVPESVHCMPTQQRARSVMVQTPSGSIEITPFALDAAPAGQYRVLLIHDLSFIAHRQTTARNFLLAAIISAAGALALLLAFTLRLLLNRWIRLLIGDISSRRFLDDAKSPRTTLPVLLKVRETLRELEVTQRQEIDFRENWTPQALQQVVREHLQACPMIVVSNREPYIHNTGADGQPVVQVPASGMVTAIEPIMRACSGTWIAHGSGSADRVVVDRHDRVRVPPDDPHYTLRRVWLSTEEEEGYYYGFSNEGLWPLCHLAYVRPAFRESDWKYYVSVNEKFADVISREAASADPVVLIQDFHFALLPGLLRRRNPRATMALFWHIPWPNAETFGVCPWKHEILEHMLAADILGFHTRYHCQNFLATVDRYIECQIDHEHMTVTHGGRVCHVAAYPISIDWPPRWLARTPPASQARSNICERYGFGPGVRIGIGVERWDFTKGIIERLQALEAFFERHPAWRGRLSFLQVAAPSRSQLPAYKMLQEQTMAEVERVNERFGQSGWRPVTLIPEHQEPEQVYELYRAADFCLVNSLHDGMNLVAKEFVAARDDDDGVLILSNFAGASRELIEALMVNPFDVSETADTIRAALEMPREERRTRMQLMRRTVAEKNVYRWAGRMLMDVARIRQRQSLERLTNSA
jgi:trehalose 6-phosphate synthase